ncbi:MAG TPA: peptide ABC transporter substrate-binding protein [Candidatus Saccharimonadales bacterium]|nr:peptide ABC transporter substrate-binding protein [Candidatus Saccharimonadales bacterium]
MQVFGNALLFYKRAFRLFGLIALIPFLLFLPGCARKEAPADIVILNGAEPESLDPAIITGQPDGRIGSALWEGLMRLDPKTATPVPALAERWEISPDGKIYTFYMRTNAFWSTGQPITAEDIVYSWRRVADPATASDYSGQLFFVKNAEAINTGKIKDLTQLAVQALDAHTLRVELIEPTPFFLDLCAFRTLYAVPRWWIEKHGDRWLMEQPLPTSGQYMLDTWRIHDKIRIRRNPHHWEAASVQNEVVDFLPNESASSALNLYETGQADIIIDKNLIPGELMDVLAKRPDCHTFDYLGTYFFRFNVTRKPFDDPRVRKALAMAVNKRIIVEKITKAGEKVATCLTPPGTANYTAPEGIPYDLEGAKKLLAEAGYPGGKGFPSFEYLFNTSEQHKQIAVELQAMWNQLGIHMDLRQTEWKVYLAAQSTLDFQTTRSSWIGDYNDPNTFLDMFMSNNGNNRTGWKNPRYDELVRKANATLDKTQRATLLAQAETILVRDDLPIVPLFFYVGINFFDTTKISGFYNNILDEHSIQTLHKIKQPQRMSRNN